MVNFRFLAMVHSPERFEATAKCYISEAGTKTLGAIVGEMVSVCAGRGGGGSRGRGSRGGIKEILSLIVLQPDLETRGFTWNRGLRRVPQVEGKVYAKAQR